MKGYRTFTLSIVGMVCMAAITIAFIMKGMTVEAVSAGAGVMAFGGLGAKRTLRRE